MSSTVSCIIRSFSEASTRSDASVSSDRDVRKRFLTIFSLLRARSADALETGKQQKMLYSMCRFGKPDNSDSSSSGLMKLLFCHCLWLMRQQLSAGPEPQYTSAELRTELNHVGCISSNTWLSIECYIDYVFVNNLGGDNFPPLA